MKIDPNLPQPAEESLVTTQPKHRKLNNNNITSVVSSNLLTPQAHEWTPTTPENLDKLQSHAFLYSPICLEIMGYLVSSEFRKFENFPTPFSKDISNWNTKWMSIKGNPNLVSYNDLFNSVLGRGILTDDTLSSLSDVLKKWVSHLSIPKNLCDVRNLALTCRKYRNLFAYIKPNLKEKDYLDAALRSKLLLFYQKAPANIFNGVLGHNIRIDDQLMVEKLLQHPIANEETDLLGTDQICTTPALTTALLRQSQTDSHNISTTIFSHLARIHFPENTLMEHDKDSIFLILTIYDAISSMKWLIKEIIKAENETFLSMFKKLMLKKGSDRHNFLYHVVKRGHFSILKRISEKFPDVWKIMIESEKASLPLALTTERFLRANSRHDIDIDACGAIIVSKNALKFDSQTIRNLCCQKYIKTLKALYRSGKGQLDFFSSTFYTFAISRDINKAVSGILEALYSKKYEQHPTTPALHDAIEAILRASVIAKITQETIFLEEAERLIRGLIMLDVKAHCLNAKGQNVLQYTLNALTDIPKFSTFPEKARDMLVEVLIEKIPQSSKSWYDILDVPKSMPVKKYADMLLKANVPIDKSPLGRKPVLIEFMQKGYFNLVKGMYHQLEIPDNFSHQILHIFLFANDSNKAFKQAINTMQRKLPPYNVNPPYIHEALNIIFQIPLEIIIKQASKDKIAHFALLMSHCSNANQKFSPGEMDLGWIRDEDNGITAFQYLLRIYRTHPSIVLNESYESISEQFFLSIVDILLKLTEVNSGLIHDISQDEIASASLQNLHSSRYRNTSLENALSKEALDKLNKLSNTIAKSKAPLLRSYAIASIEL